MLKSLTNGLPNLLGKSTLETYQIIVNLIAATKTSKGLEVKADLDPNIYQTGIKVSDKEKEMEKVNIYRHEFHGENWNYTIKPNE